MSMWTSESRGSNHEHVTPRSDSLSATAAGPNGGLAPAHGALGASPPEVLRRLHLARDAHPFWNNRLLRACASGSLTRDDFAVIFAQYSLYTQTFTRFLAGLMANSECDLHRARLAENLWEEAGCAAPEQRHAQIFRRFLEQGLHVEPSSIEFLDATRLFVREYLDFCLDAHPAAGSAFLSLGTEGIVPRLYSVLLEGLRHAGLSDDIDGVFPPAHRQGRRPRRHARGHDLSYSSMPDWPLRCEQAMDPR